jgi:hypothetical protein
VSLEIVEHDDVALLQSLQEIVLKQRFERLGVHGMVIGLGRDDASQAQGENEGDRFVMAKDVRAVLFARVRRLF